MLFSDAKEMTQIKGTVYNKPPTSFDPVLGYRWNQGIRFTRLANGEIVCDRHPKINGQGFHCSFEYEKRKPSGRAFRFIAIGDSFTNDLSCSEAWPETLHRFLRSRREHGVDVQVYGMPTDGGGLLNWYTVLKEYIVPDYELDALIIADWGDDLSREWAFSHSTQTKMLWSRVGLDERPASVDEVLSNADKMEKACEVASDEEIDELLARLRNNADPQPVTVNYERKPREIPPGHKFSPESFKERYGEDRFSILEEIMQTCRERRITVVYSELPEHGDVHYLIDNPGAKTFRQVQGQWIAGHFGVSWFDGCSLFADIAAKSLTDFYWLKYDGHWNQGASTYYAMRLAEWIISEGLIG